MTLRIIAEGSPLVFETAESDTDDDTIRIQGFQSALLDHHPGKCLICGKLRTGDEDPDGSSRQRIDLETLCDTLLVGNREGILELIEEDRIRHQIKFCLGCQQNLDAFNNLQIQLQDINLKILQLRGLVSNAFLESNDAILSAPAEGTELRNYILAECPNPEAKHETITVLANPISFVSDDEDNGADDFSQQEQYPYHEQSKHDEDEWIPRRTPVTSRTLATTRLRRHPKNGKFRESPHLTKPCQVTLIRIDHGSGADPKKMRREHKKRLRLLIQKFKKDKVPGPRPLKRRKLSSSVSKGSSDVESSGGDPPKRSARPKRTYKWKTKGKFTCPFEACREERFRAETHVGYHIKKVHEGHPKPFDCKACTAEFEALNELYDHIRKEHSKIAQCPTCGRQLRGYGNLASHYRRQGGICSIDPLPLNSTVDLSCPDPKKFTCGACGQRFNRRNLLLIHVKSAHSEGFPFICEFCCKPFKREDGIKTHQRLHHPEQYKESFNIDEETFLKEIKDSTCEICNKTFASPHVKRLHDTKHTKKYKVTCEICGIGFTSNSHLITHQVIHKTEREHGCTHCSLRFNRVDKLKRHLQQIHSIGGKTKEFACEFCPKLFWDNFALQRHKKLMHRDTLPEGQEPKEHRCDLCNYTSFDKWYLKIHLKSKRHKETEARHKPDMDSILPS